MHFEREAPWTGRLFVLDEGLRGLNTSAACTTKSARPNNVPNDFICDPLNYRHRGFSSMSELCGKAHETHPLEPVALRSGASVIHAGTLARRTVTSRCARWKHVADPEQPRQASREHGSGGVWFCVAAVASVTAAVALAARAASGNVQLAIGQSIDSAARRISATVGGASGASQQGEDNCTQRICRTAYAHHHCARHKLAGR